jgi:hypothetical protein
MPRLFLAIAVAAGTLVAASTSAVRAEGLLIIANPSVDVATPLGISQISAI